MSDKTLAQLPLAINASGALLYGVQGGTDVAISAELLQQQMPAQGANLVYAGPSGPPGALPSFRRLVVNDIPDLSALYLASTGGNLVATTINNSTIIGGSISGTTAVFDDNKFTIRDEADTTKQAKWEASGISAGTTRTYSLPNENGTVTLNTADQALTNKSVFLKASAPAGATLRVPHGVPPLSPVNGDIWTTAGGMYARIDGTTIGPFASAQSGYVTSFNTRVGAVTLNQSDVTNALGYTPWNTGTNLNTSSNINAGAFTGTTITGTTVSDSSGNLRTGIDAKVSKSGDTMTGVLRVNNVVKIQDAGGSMLRFISNGAGITAIHSVDAGETTYVPLNMTASDYNLTSSGSVNIGTLQLKVAGPAIPTGAFAGYTIQSLQASPGSSADYFNTSYYRSNGSSGTSWNDFTWRIGRTVDVTQMQYLEFQPNGDMYFNLGTGSGGNVRFTSAGAVVASGGFGPGSDPRLKDSSSLKNVDNALEKVYNLNVRYGKYHDWYNPDGKERVFLMADKALKDNVPQAVLKDSIEKDGTTYDGWSADQMIALLVKAVQELTDDVAELRSALKEKRDNE